MRSESTSALGQPSETKPTLGTEATGTEGRSALVLAAFVPLGLVGIVRRGSAEVGEGEAPEEVARLLLELVLHVHERARALLEVAAHEPLDRRPLHLHELRPRLRAEHRVLAVELPRLVLEALLNVDEGVDVLLEVAAHHPLHGVAVEADDLREHVGGEHRSARALLLENDLQQDGARQVFLALRVLDPEIDVLENELFHVGERDVAARLGVVEPAIRILLDDSRRLGHVFRLGVLQGSDYSTKANTYAVRR